MDKLQVSLQHKSTDRRDKRTGGRLDLPPEERRARMEVMLAGEERLGAAHGIRQVGELAAAESRKLQKAYLAIRGGKSIVAGGAWGAAGPDNRIKRLERTSARLTQVMPSRRLLRGPVF